MQQLTTGTLLRGGSYKIEEILGQGSFGITYLAEHTNLNRKVAIKEFFMKDLNSRGADGSITGMTDGSLSYNYCVKFQKEAINLSRLDHPNIVRVTDSFSENGTFYYVMDYIEGQNLNDYIKGNNVDAEESVDIIKSVADALIYMHEEKHMLHLDLKPGNVMRRNSDGHIFLIDFGLSKHFCEDGQPETSTTIGLGTAGYAPVEQGNRAKNGEFRPTIDVYALGATLYKLLTRETPPAVSDLVSDDELLENNLRAKGVSDNLVKAIVDAMCPNVRKRTQSIRDFKNSIESIQTDALDCIPTEGSEVDVAEDTIVTPTEMPVVEEQAIEISQNISQKQEEEECHSIWSFNGRVGRKAYWITLFGGFIAFLLIFFCSVEIERRIGDVSCEACIFIPLVLSYLIYSYVVLTVGAKRCHDLGHSGWFQMIPYYCFVMLFSSGKKEENEFGKKGDGISKKSLGLLYGITTALFVIICICASVVSVSQGGNKTNSYGNTVNTVEDVYADSVPASGYDDTKENKVARPRFPHETTRDVRVSPTADVAL